MQRLKLFVFGLFLIAGLVAFGSGGGDKKLRIVFCNVGQGDAVLITLGSEQILIDGGPERGGAPRLMDCLGKHIPFWDRQIEMVILTHPQADHMSGLLAVLKRYKVDRFATGMEANATDGYEELKRLVETKVNRRETQFINLYAGDVVDFKSSSFEFKLKIVWPERNWVLAHLTSGGVALANGGAVLGAKTDGEDLNSFCVGVILQYVRFKALFTGDADERVEDEMLEVGLIEDVDILKVPHHGSKTGMIPQWLDFVNPELAVISVGQGNRYGHPRKEALDMLSQKGIKTLRTDRDGEVVVESDGEIWKIVN